MCVEKHCFLFISQPMLLYPAAFPSLRTTFWCPECDLSYKRMRFTTNWAPGVQMENIFERTDAAVTLTRFFSPEHFTPVLFKRSRPFPSNFGLQTFFCFIFTICTCTILRPAASTATPTDPCAFANSEGQPLSKRLIPGKSLALWVCNLYQHAKNNIKKNKSLSLNRTLHFLWPAGAIEHFGKHAAPPSSNVTTLCTSPSIPPRPFAVVDFAGRCGGGGGAGGAGGHPRNRWMSIRRRLQTARRPNCK